MKIAILFTLFCVGGVCTAQNLQANMEKICRESLNRNRISDAPGKIISLKNERRLWVPDKYTNKRTGTLDSERGELNSPDLTINYDIGFSAGAHMGKHKRNECSAYFDTTVNGHDLSVGVLKDRMGQGKLVVTNWGDLSKNAFDFPANFWATVNNEMEAREILQIAFSYKPKGK